MKDITCCATMVNTMAVGFINWDHWGNKDDLVVIDGESGESVTDPFKYCPFCGSKLHEEG